MTKNSPYSETRFSYIDPNGPVREINIENVDEFYKLVKENNIENFNIKATTKFECVANTSVQVYIDYEDFESEEGLINLLDYLKTKNLKELDEYILDNVTLDFPIEYRMTFNTGE